MEDKEEPEAAEAVTEAAAEAVTEAAVTEGAEGENQASEDIAKKARATRMWEKGMELQIELFKKQADASEPRLTNENKVTCPLPPPPLYSLS